MKQVTLHAKIQKFLFNPNFKSVDINRKERDKLNKLLKSFRLGTKVKVIMKIEREK